MALPVLFFACVFVSCGTNRRIDRIQRNRIGASLSLPDGDVSSFSKVDTSSIIREDTISITIDGHDMVLMHAVQDDESGEMVAAQELRPAVVSARFRNIAERNGRIDIGFRITVPEDMQDSRWQLRFYPDMVIMGDTVHLDRLLITGAEYRKSQLRGYQQYERFLSRIVSDTSLFVDIRNLEIFLQRNIPEAYSFRNDTSFVSDEEFESAFGVTERMALDHYTDKFARRANERRISRKEKMWKRYVKSPIVRESIRLDTVITGLGGEVSYDYVQTISTRKNLRKVQILLSGDIFESDRHLYSIPGSEPLTFYISSLSSLVDGRERYLTKVLERRVEANAAWYIDFRQGSDDIDAGLSDNRRQIDNIKMNLRHLVDNPVFDMDSITITAFASPEGSEPSNYLLSKRRAGSVVKYFGRYVESLRDSIKEAEGIRISLAEDYSEAIPGQSETISFKSTPGGENWFLLDHLVENDSLLTDIQKSEYRKLASSTRDLDARERALSGEPYYRHLRENLYPLLRTVQFNFYLHRKGMVKDTVHTTVLDSVYMKGVKALAERDYESALTLLMPYNDYNTAVAFVSMDRNVSAMSILQNLPRTSRVNYLLAILYARKGDIRNAVQCYLTSCSQDPSFVHRGNLDPEISELIREYNLNQ